MSLKTIVIKVFRFFFPKDFWGEVRRGMMIGEVKGKQMRRNNQDKK